MTAQILRDPASLSPLERNLLAVPPALRVEAARRFVEALPYERREVLRYAWRQWWARPNQLLPTGTDWVTWVIRAGRGMGKTRSGAEAVRELVNTGRAEYVTIVGPTAADTRDLMIEGPSGIVQVHPPDIRPTYEPSKRLLTWPNGATGHARSAANPDELRGLNSDLVWGDEPSSWLSGVEAWDNAMLGLRLGKPHAILTGTPRPLPWLKELEARSSTHVTVGSTYENAANLAPEFVALILERYEGTRLGAQELHAHFLEDVEGALWVMSSIEQSRIYRFDPADPWNSLARALPAVAPRFGRAVPDYTTERRRWVTAVGVDPPGETAEAGIVVVTAPEDATFGRDDCVVLDDRSLAGPPETWGSQVAATYHDHHADVAVVEANQGGDMVRSTIHAADPDVVVEKVRASESKQARAEPVSVLYAKGWVHHRGNFPTLENQQCTWVPTEGKSPDRIDALVHAVAHLIRFEGISSASIPDQLEWATTRL